MIWYVQLYRRFEANEVLYPEVFYTQTFKTKIYEMSSRQRQAFFICEDNCASSPNL